MLGRRFSPLIFAGLLVACGGGDDCQAGAPLFAPAAAKQQCSTGEAASAVPRPAVLYSVTGTAQRASLTYTARDGSTQQEQVMLPWSTAFQGIDRNFLYLSAQILDDASAAVAVSISIDGVQAKSGESVGRYVIATASTWCC